MKIGILSDTHVPARARFIPPQIFQLFDKVDLILHAGDFVSRMVFEELSTITETRGVAGNMDDSSIRASLPDRDVMELDGVKLGMVHDSGLSKGRLKRMRSIFPDCRIVVFGHSHQPLIEDEDGLMLLNPGSACDPRRAREPTVALLTIQDKRVEAKLIEL